MGNRTTKHKYPWAGSALVTRVSAKCYIGQRSGLLFAETRCFTRDATSREFVQTGSETPFEFWKRVSAEVCGQTCKCCGQEITDEAATAAKGAEE